MVPNRWGLGVRLLLRSLQLTYTAGVASIGLLQQLPYDMAMTENHTADTCDN